MSQKPWIDYRVGKPSNKKNFTNNDCRPFDTISHVTHLGSAFNVIRQRVIRPQLVYDESLLNTRRVLVNWASPNYWNTGFRYGNVSFNFPWARLIAGKRFYWVEVMPYEIEACRILVTDKDYDDDEELKVYDPRSAEGPWWWDEASNTHFYNNNICLEIMLETELSDGLWASVTFVDHHPKYCCINAKTCPHLSLDKQDAGARFLAAIVSADLNIAALNFDHHQISSSWNALLMSLKRDGYAGDVSTNDTTATALARSIASAFYYQRKEEQQLLAMLFKSPFDLESSLKTLIANKFPGFDLGEPRFDAPVDF